MGPPQVIDTRAEGARWVFEGDVDGDGDLDVLAAGRYGDGSIVWYENVDGAGGFGRQRLIATQAYWWAADVGDLDGDGDLDVISGSRDDDLGWYENTDGAGSFGPRQAIALDGPRPRP